MAEIGVAVICVVVVLVVGWDITCVVCGLTIVVTVDPGIMVPDEAVLRFWLLTLLIAVF